MTTYFVDDSGDNSDGSTWAKAYTSINALDTAVALASGDTVVFGADSQCQATNSADLTIVGPTAGVPVSFISSTVGTGTTISYEAATGNQIDTTEGAYDIKLDGSFSLTGIRLKAGGDVWLANDNNESIQCENCYFLVGDDYSLTFATGGISAITRLINCTLDLTTDTPTCPTSAVVMSNSGQLMIQGLAITNGEERTGKAIDLFNGYSFELSGIDFSSMTSITELADVGQNGGRHYLTNCKIPTGIGLVIRETLSNGWQLFLQNVGTADSETALSYFDNSLDIISSVDVYRTGGAEVSATPISWLVDATTAANVFSSPGYSPWICGETDITGSATFALYIVNDTADFSNAEVWLEVEYKSTVDEPTWVLAHDRAMIATAGTTQDDDTTSTWTGTGPSFTYKQKLSVSATIGEVGQYRARVAIAAASLSDLDNFYIDPAVTVS